MFFSQDILTKKGGCLGIVWIAANFEPGLHRICLTRREYCSVNISKACKEVVSPHHPMALRLSASLMVGILRVYRQQTHYVYVESKSVWQRIKTAYEKIGPATDLPGTHTRVEAVTLPDPTLLVSPNVTFPGASLGFSSPMEFNNEYNFFSLSSLVHTTPTPPLPQLMSGGNPYTADPRDISMEEDEEAPLEAMQIVVPGDEDFGEGQLKEGVSSSMMMMDNVLMPTLDISDETGCGGDVNYSLDTNDMERPAEAEAEEGGGEGGEVLLFDESTNSFQFYNEQEPTTQQCMDGHTQSLIPPEQIDQQAQTPELKTSDSAPPLPSRRVRRKLAFDANIKMKSSCIKHNMETIATTLRDKYNVCHPLPPRVKPALLLVQPVCKTTIQSRKLLADWCRYQKQPEFTEEKEFELDVLPAYNDENTPAPHNISSRTHSASVLSEQEVARAHSDMSSLGASSMEIVRGDEGDRLLESHHTTATGASISDISSFNSTHQHSSMTFETSSAQRQPALSKHLPPLPNMGGLSPIPDVDRETETSFSTQQGDLGFPDLDSSGESLAASRLLREDGETQSVDTQTTRYLQRVCTVMGNRIEFQFQELLPRVPTRREASRAFSNVLALINSAVLRPTQNIPYGTITLTRGDNF